MVVPVVLTGESPNVTIMTFNVKWLVDSEELVARLKSKRIWGLESRDEESEMPPTMKLSPTLSAFSRYNLPP